MLSTVVAMFEQNKSRVERNMHNKIPEIQISTYLDLHRKLEPK